MNYSSGDEQLFRTDREIRASGAGMIQIYFNHQMPGRDRDLFSLEEGQ